MLKKADQILNLISTISLAILITALFNLLILRFLGQYGLLLSPILTSSLYFYAKHHPLAIFKSRKFTKTLINSIFYANLAICLLTVIMFILFYAVLNNLIN